MKRIILLLSIFSTTVSYAQEKDTLKSTELEEIIIKSVLRKNSDYTNKMPLKAIENPQSYSTVDRIFFDNQFLNTVDEAYRNVTGVQKMWNATNRAGDGGAYITLRGFTSNNSMRNGLVAPVTTSIDAINVEKLEVLKGPSATLYGSNVSSYGGVINRVTKKPYDSFGGNVSLIGGSYNYYRAQADINTPITKDNKLLFRINTAYTNAGTFQKADAKNSFFAITPSLLYKINDKLEISLEYEFYDTKTTPEQSFFYLSKATTGVNNIKDLEKLGLDYKQSYYGSGMYTKAKVSNLFGQINYKINEHIRSNTNVSTAYTYSDGLNPYFAAYVDINDDKLYVSRGDQSTNGSKKTYFQIQQNFNFDYHFANDMRNRTVVGLDYMHIKNDLKYLYLTKGFFDNVPATGYDYANTFNASILNALYADPANVSNYDQIDSQNTYSAYISNVFTPVKGLNIMTAIRFESNDFKGGKLWVNDVQPYNQSAFSPKFGAVYQIIEDKFSVFANYQNSFKSNGYYFTDEAANTSLSDPEKANQFEGGFKGNLVRGRVNATLSYYNIRVKNTLYTLGYIPGTFNAYQNQSGKMKSEGVELEVNAYLVKGLSLVGGISYNNSKFIISDPTTQARRPATAGSPWLASLYASYQFLDGKLNGLGFGIGGNYASANNELNSFDPSTNTENIFTLPKYLVINASTFYDMKKIRIGVKVDNLTNQHYWLGFTTANPQPLINVLGSVTYKFN